MSYSVVMPRAGLTMVAGTITKWKVEEGVSVQKGQSIMEYENEKSAIDCEALESGIIHIVKQPGDTVPVGELIALLAADKSEYDKLAKGEIASLAPAADTAASDKTDAPTPLTANIGGVTEIGMPRAGLTMVEGTITSWKADEGVQVAKGQEVMEYENEKNAITYEIVHGGFLHIIAQVGDVVKVGEPIAFVADTKEIYDSLLKHGGPVSANAAEVKAADACAPVSVPAGARIRATGLAKRRAAEAGIDLSKVQPSGGPDRLRIIARDIEEYQKNQKTTVMLKPKDKPEDDIKVTPWTGIRKTIARNMFNSLQQSAQCTCSCEMDVTELLALRGRLLENQEELGCRVTVNDLLCKMLGKVMVKHPRANGTFDGEKLYSYKHVHLSVAVGAEDGLLVPVLRNVDTMCLIDISMAVKDLASRAKERKLNPDEQVGGTFTISNVGMYPIDSGTPVINPPQIAICGFGRTVKKPVFMPDDSIAVRSMMNVFLTFDHRVVDGLEAGRIFKDIKSYIENPDMILA